MNEKENWLEEWWDDITFLALRGPIAINVSPYGGLKPQPAHLPQTPAARAAGLTHAAMIFRQRLHSGKLMPDMAKDTELCMDAYRWLFDSCRIPGAQGVDWSVSHAGTPNPHDDLGDVIVIRNNRFWKIKAQVEDVVVGMGDLTRQFQYIYDHTTGEHLAIGTLTAQNRDMWVKDLALLSSIPCNELILRKIQSSAFVVSLDESTALYENDVDVSKALWHGMLPSPANPTEVSCGFSSRYFDKPLQFIVLDNSVAGVVTEHSIIDGTLYCRLLDDLMEILADPKSDLQLSPSPSATTTPEPLDFDLAPISEVREAITRSQRFVHEIASSKSLSFLRINYGKAAIKALGLGPDGWTEMIVQLAYARLAERFSGKNGPVLPWPVPTCQTVTTRKFYKGRFQDIMVVSDECVAFVRAMLADTATKDMKVQLLRDAVKKHQRLVSETTTGENVDNHVKGLCFCRPPSMPEPSLFTDSLYNRAMQGVLHTSVVNSTSVRVYGWAALHPNGFGIAYIFGSDDVLQFTVTSDRRMPNAQFVEEIRKAAEELYELFTGSEGASVSQERRTGGHGSGKL